MPHETTRPLRPGDTLLPPYELELKPIIVVIEHPDTGQDIERGKGHHDQGHILSAERHTCEN